MCLSGLISYQYFYAYFIWKLRDWISCYVYRKEILELFLTHKGSLIDSRGHRGRDHMVVGFITAYAISGYHHLSCEFEFHSRQGMHDTTLCDKVCR